MSFVEKFASKTRAGSGSSMAAKIVREKAVVYALWVNQPHDRRAYFVIEVDRAKHKEFDNLVESNATFDFAEFGNILYMDWAEPSSELKAELNEKYGLYD